MPYPIKFSLFILLYVVCSFSSLATEQVFTLSGKLKASASQLTGTLALKLVSGDAVYHPKLVLKGQSSVKRYDLPSVIDEGKNLKVKFNLSSKHKRAGKYHLLAELIFQDKAGAWLHSPLMLSYTYKRGKTAKKNPNVDIDNGQLRWSGTRAVQNLKLDMSAAPAWKAVKIYNPKHTSYQLRAVKIGSSIPNFSYQQVARLSWVENGIHQSRVIHWQLNTDKSGLPRESHSYLSGVEVDQSFILVFSIILLCLAMLVLLKFSALNLYLSKPIFFWLIPIGLGVWIAQVLQFEYWSQPTLTTGGDTASHIFYAHVFEDWIEQGRISGWLPEVFAGLPAFQYYFPLPFVLMAFLAKWTGMAIAFKWISLLPAVLLPLAVYWTTGRWQWSVMPRALAALGATGFMMTHATSIWGGNLLSILAGEFSYAWGLLLSILLFGAVFQALKKGGRYWLLAVLLEVAVAMSHGYALLVSGFAIFIFVLFTPAMFKGLLQILSIHLAAFLLLGFWLFPLFESHAWTIPNDTFFQLGRWELLWPMTLAPFLLGILAAIWLLIQSPKDRIIFLMPLMIALVAAVLFFFAQLAQLAEIRFYPYVQLLLVLSLTGALGALIDHYQEKMNVLLPIGLCLFAIGFWSAEAKQAGDWAKWNLQGYEAKPLWPEFKAMADDLQGDLSQPRIAFEHDPANSDLGSTRNLEALPLFGTRPVLEGLYMESAITAPFIYQLQAEISKRPSSPLSRFPAVKDSPERAIGHMKELYTDTLLLRSKKMKKRFSRHKSFELIAKHGPFSAFKLKQSVSLVEVLKQPLVAMERNGWLEKSFQRFRLKVPYQQRQVYVSEGQVLPQVSSIQENIFIQPDIKRESIRFTTTQLGKPHLIRMAYHPKWSSVQGEPIYLIEPAFMLIYPKAHQVILEYGLTWADQLGRFASALGILFCVFMAFYYQFKSHDIQFIAIRIWLVLLSVVLIAGVAYSYNPERYYQKGHQLFKAKIWSKSAQAFAQSAKIRPYGAARAEALFWSGRAYHLSGDLALALKAYQQVVDIYPANYWAAESLFYLIEFSNKQEFTLDRKALLLRMEKDYGHSKWMKRIHKN